MTFTTLNSCTSERSRELTAALEEYPFRNRFNPSLARHGGRTFVAFRALEGDGGPPFRAYMAIVEGAKVLSIVDLTEHCAGYGVAPVADPKLFVHDRELWVTFNTGYSAHQNDLYVQRLTPVPGKPLRCLLEKRRPVEKNWAFFERRGALHGLYSLSPPTCIVEEDRDEGAGWVRFVRVGSGRGREGDGVGDQVSIGTPLAMVGEQAYLIAHQKIHVGKWRAYLGRLARLDLAEPQPSIELSERRLFHTYRALLGPRRRFNPNMLSCTYFAGLIVDGANALLSYGINDTNWAIRETTLEALW